MSVQDLAKLKKLAEAGGSGVTTGTEHHPECQGDCRLCPIEIQVQCECEGKKFDVQEILTDLAAALAAEGGK